MKVLFRLLPLLILIVATSFYINSCGSSSSGGGGDTGTISITAPDSDGMTFLVGTANTVSGEGTVTATNISETASTTSVSPSSLVSGCTKTVNSNTSHADGSFSSIGICADVNDRVRVTYEDSSGNTSTVETLTVPSNDTSSCSDNERKVTIKNTASQDIWLGIAAGAVACTSNSDCDSNNCVGADPTIDKSGTCNCASDSDCGDLAQCNTDNNICFFRLPSLSKGQMNLTKTEGHSVICIPAPGSGAIQWSGNMFARTGCDSNGQSCDTGDCGAGSDGICPVGTGGNPPATLFEFTFSNQTGADVGDDFYDESIINGVNLGMSVDVSGGEADSADPYSCASPGSKTADGDLEACSWSFDVTVDGTDRTTLLRDVKPSTITGTCPDGSSSPNSLGYCECTADSDCSSESLLCGNALNASSSKYTMVCGTMIGYWTANQICGSTINTGSPFGEPLNCDTEVTNNDGTTSTNTNFHLCTQPDGTTDPEQAQSCYNDAATVDCCGCGTSASSSLSSDWPTALTPNFGGSDNGCFANNSRWVTIAQTWLVFLKLACPTVYTYPFDDATSTFTCHKGSSSIPTYTVTFFDID